MVVSEITWYNALKEKLGEQLAQTVVEGIKETVKEEVNNKKDSLASKQDIAEAKVDIMRWMFGVFAMLMLAIIGLYFKK
jgi:hypothetical protein